MKNYPRKIFAFISYSFGAYLLSAQIFFPLFKSLPQGGTQLSSPGRLPPLREEKLISGVKGAQSDNKEAFLYLDVPKLGIENAMVKLNAPDINPQGYIGHLKGTVLPGEKGASFLYGHSVLPWFFDPQNYDTIFSTLHNLNFGDSFGIVRNKQLLTFEVVYKITLNPDEVSPFMESGYFSNQDSWVILMTCTPAGLDTKRLLVIGKLKN